MDEAYIVNPDTDRSLAFMAGFFGTAFGLAAVIVVGYRWASDAPDGQAAARWRHARTMWKWSGVGFATVLALVAILLIVGFAASGLD